MYLQGGKKSVKLFTYQANPFFLVFKRTLFQIFKVKTGRGKRANSPVQGLLSFVGEAGEHVQLLVGEVYLHLLVN